MSQKSYLAKRQVYLSNGAFYVRAGDILKYSEDTRELKVFRGGELKVSVTQTPTGINGLVGTVIEEMKVDSTVATTEPATLSKPIEVEFEKTGEFSVEITQETSDSSPVVKLAELTKVKLAEHAKTLGLVLDPNNLNKPDMIAKIESHVSETEDPKDEEKAETPEVTE